MRLHNFFNLNEAERNDVNFDSNDIKRLEGINDLNELKKQAFSLITKNSDRPMKPAKVSWFKRALISKTNKMAVIKMMYDLMLSGEGHSVIGTATSTAPNSYRANFGEGEGDAAVGYGPYDRGVADGYYGRQPKPHKYVTNAEGKRIPVKLTDPREIAAYMAGFNDDSFGSKDYSENVDLNELSKDTLKRYVPARLASASDLKHTNLKKAQRIVSEPDGDIRRAMNKLRDPKYGKAGK